MDIKLEEYFLPSPDCDCEVCKAYCQRPGWWTVEQASMAIYEDLAGRMMLEVAPDFSFAVLSPAFKGCEGLIATNEFSNGGCNFLSNGLCDLHSTEIQPLECKVCHHDFPGLGMKIHQAIEKEWKSPLGQKLVIEWMEKTGFWQKLTNNPGVFRKRST